MKNDGDSKSVKSDNKLKWSDSSVRVKSIKKTLNSENAKKNRKAIEELKKAGIFDSKNNKSKD